MSATKTCSFRFYAELNDFLPRQKRFKTFLYTFNLNPSVKDAIEALGIPHPEVDLILADSKSVDFSYRLREGDLISVYPTFELLDIGLVTRLRPKPLRISKFILDVNLGKLARKLRLFGFDSLYSNSFKDKEIIEISLEEKRIILTRDMGLLKDKRTTHGYWVRSTDIHTQINEVVSKYDLYSAMKPFSICLECNGKIMSTAKEEIEHLLLPKTKKSFDEFYRCDVCKKIYWKGPHYLKMAAFVQNLQKKVSLSDVE